MNCIRKFPIRNKEVLFSNVKGNNYIFDSVSGTIAKTNDFVNDVLKECNGVNSTEKIYQKLDLEHLGYTTDELYDLLNKLEEYKFLQIIDRDVNLFKNIVLVNPPFPYRHERYNTSYYTPPLGLIQIAAELEKKDYIVHIIDMAVLDLKPYEIIDCIKKLGIEPIIIGISCNMTFTASNAIRIANNIKDIYPFTKIIFGGNHVTFCYEQILKNEDSVDYINLYEGEIVFPNLCDYIIQGKDLKSCKGIAYKNEDGEIVKTKSQKRIENLDNLEFPAYHLLNMDLYNETMKGIVMTSRGCPHQCVYCSTAKFNGNVNYYSIDKVIENVKRMISEFDLKQITFGDDAFTINKKRVLEMCKRIQDEKINISWSCNTRVDMVDEEIFTALKEAGCKDVLFGIESVSDKVLGKVNKRFYFEDIKRSVTLAKKVGIRIKQNYIIGLPYETQETLDEMREYINQTNPEVVEFCILCLFPGTELYINESQYGIKNFNVPWEKLQLIKPGLETEWLTSKQLLDNYILSWNSLKGR